ncbi:MAG: FHA domain-containing protein [Proteobacteria bacterium]|nr:FHA domain-containing protein [Pseudomonadota bacterium]
MSTRSTAQKSLQNFQARKTLWSLFEIRAQEMDCSIDYLINEAMRLYATTHGFLDSDDEVPRKMQYSPADEARAFRDRDTLSPSAKSTVPGLSDVAPPALPRPGSGTPRAPSMRPSSPPSLPRPTSAMEPGQGPSQPPMPRPPREGMVVPPAPGLGTPSAQPGLMLVFQGRKVPITGGQFIIGRGSKASDLAIKDANISRKHAAVIFHNGAYYIKDLGSTNGIEYKGQQVDSKRIDEGDVFSICGYELHFTYSV